MGGKISNENTRINLVMPLQTRCLLEKYTRKINLSMSKAIVKILFDFQLGSSLDDFDFSEIAASKNEARINIVISKEQREVISKEAEANHRSVNNYINSKIYMALSGSML